MSTKLKEIPVLSEHVSLIDTHCHLDMDAYAKDLEDVLARAKKYRVNHIITIGIDLASSRKAIQLAMKYPGISATVGVHPHDVDQSNKYTYDSLAALAERHRDQVVGYGEIGLDYVKKYADPVNQKEHFANQLALARELRLPVIVHDREAHEDTLKILKDSGPLNFGGVMHCFSGDAEFARKVIDLGFYVSIPGVVTFKNGRELQDVAKIVPLNSLLVETDGPFLSPHPMRGKRNEPTHVIYTADCIARLRGISLDEVARTTTENACTLFNLETPAVSL